MKHKRGWTWGAEHETTKELMESCIEDYLINELNVHGLHTVVGPDGRKYNIKVVAELCMPLAVS